MKHRTTISVLLLCLAFSASYACAQDATAGVRKVVTNVQPQYPSIARTMNIRGSVRVEVVVATNGTVKSAEVKGGHPLLAEAAQNAVRRWKWEPAAHETLESIEFRFNP
jgi:TonB family protein